MKKFVTSPLQDRIMCIASLYLKKCNHVFICFFLKACIYSVHNWLIVCFTLSLFIVDGLRILDNYFLLLLHENFEQLLTHQVLQAWPPPSNACDWLTGRRLHQAELSGVPVPRYPNAVSSFLISSLLLEDYNVGAKMRGAGIPTICFILYLEEPLEHYLLARLQKILE